MRRKYGKEVVMQEDGAKYHFAPIPAKYKDSSNIKRLEWPPQSPDLSPIENLWKRLKDKISERRHRIRTIQEMEVALQQEWAKIEEDFLDKLMDSMPRRIKQMLQNKGGSIKY